MNAIRVPYKKGSGYARSGITSAAGKHYTPHPQGTPVDDVWDIPMINPMAAERLGYPTQKPEALLERIIKASSRPGDLVADVFCGSGTFAAVADRLDRPWIAVDSGALAVHTTRKRLLDARCASPPDRVSRPFRLVELAPESAPEPFSGNASSFSCPENARFTHTACLQNRKTAYVITDIRITAHISGGSGFWELGGFSVHPPAGVPDIKHNDPLYPLFEGGWRYWLDYWSVGFPGGAFFAREGMTTDPLCNRLVWHGSRSRKTGAFSLCSPELALPCPRPDMAVVTLIDIFANESRVTVPLIAQ